MAIKTAVILLNLGGPQSLSQVKGFLFNLFYDKTILNIPNPLRYLIAKIISITRNKKAQKIYSLLGGRSPILAETIAQAQALQDQLDQENFKVFVCMRHANPNIDDLEKEITKYNPEQIIAIPLYPQFSYTTTHSAVEQIKERFKTIKTKFIGCFYSSKQFIDGQVELIQQALKEVDKSKTTILFSAHSLPKKIIINGDPYQHQIEETVALIMKQIDGVNYKITYQSKVGPVEWIGPNTEDVIIDLANKKEQIVIVPISFVSEHSETLVELDIDYAKLAANTKYVRVPALRTNKKFIACLKELVEQSIVQEKQITSNQGIRLCDSKFKYCICK
jgi:ferrochelatase